MLLWGSSVARWRTRLCCVIAFAVSKMRTGGSSVLGGGHLDY